MSAADWRRAMSAGAGRAAMLKKAVAVSPSNVSVPLENPDAPRWLQWIWARVEARHVFVLAAVLVYPWVATPFFTYQIGAQSLALGLIALSLTFLGGYGGMVSLAQMTIAGVAGYVVAILGVSAVGEISFKWPWWVGVPIALAAATVVSAGIGWL
jgi:branched-chain amino acid transport system permease protein